jgi:hypothetical protein
VPQRGDEFREVLIINFLKHWHNSSNIQESTARHPNLKYIRGPASAMLLDATVFPEDP